MSDRPLWQQPFVALLSALLSMPSLSCGGSSPGNSPTASPASRRAFAEHLVPESECRAPGPATLERDAMRRDLEVLERLFERGYAGRSLAGSEHAWAAARRSASDAIPEQLTIEGFRDLLIEHYRWLDDNHVGFWFFDPERQWRSTGQHRSPWVALPAAHPSEGSRASDFTDCRPAARPALLAAPAIAPAADAGAAARSPALHGSVPTVNPGFRLVPRPLVLASAEPGTLRCPAVGGDGADLEPLAPFRDPGGPVFERNGGRIVLRSLMTPQADAIERFVASASSLGREPVVLIDLRFTGGGADRYLVRFFAHFTSQPLRYWSTGALVSETTLQGARNFWGCVREASEDPGEAGRAWLDRRIARADRDLAQGARRGPFYDLRQRRKHVPPKADAPFAGRLIVVTGPGCASACETAVLLAKQMPRTWIVGQNTHGTMKVGELRWYRLPESRIWVALGRRAHTDPFGRFTEGRGFVPDVWIDGANAEARLNELYRCAADERCAAAVDSSIAEAATAAAP